MTPREMIDRRRSVRSYTAEPLSPALREEVLATLSALPPLTAEARLFAKLIGRSEARCTLPMPWLPQDLLAVYAEEETMALVNVGYTLGRLDLILQSRGLGTCWLGVGRPRSAPEENGLPFAIMMALGYPKDVPLRRGAADFRRHPQERITDVPDERLEPARLAPSAVNGQPWYFTHEEERIHVFCTARRSRLLHDMQRIDVGIALAHLATASPETFAFTRTDPKPALAGHEYIGTVTL